MATVIENFFSKQELEVLQSYCYNRLDADKDYKIDHQSFSPAYYYDPLMTAFLKAKLPLVEQESNLKLFQTYAYWRYYVFGATLKKHTDRPACEISITACIKKYDDWSIIVDGKSFELKEGDAVLYAGCEEEHYRPGIYKGNGIAQAFFHYVNQNGKHKDHAFDQLNRFK